MSLGPDSTGINKVLKVYLSATNRVAGFEEPVLAFSGLRTWAVGNSGTEAPPGEERQGGAVSRALMADARRANWQDFKPSWF